MLTWLTGQQSVIENAKSDDNEISGYHRNIFNYNKITTITTAVNMLPDSMNDNEQTGKSTSTSSGMITFTRIFA